MLKINRFVIHVGQPVIHALVQKINALHVIIIKKPFKNCTIIQENAYLSAHQALIRISKLIIVMKLPSL